MDIYWYGHACFRLRSTAANMSVVTDPFPPEDPKAAHPLSNINEPTVVTVSHDERMHNHTKAVPGNTKIFTMPGEYELSGIAIRATMTPLPEGIPRKQRNVAYAIKFDGITVCNLGSIATSLIAEQIDNIAPVDVLIAPAGGPDTPFIEHRALAQLARQLGARILIPMLFSTDDPNEHGEPAACQSFLRDLGVAAGAAQPQNRIQVTTNNMPPSMQVMVMEPPQIRRPARRRRASS